MTVNRHERRKANSDKTVVAVDLGRLQQRNPNYGLTLACWLCGAIHAAAGLARIRARGSANIHVPLCDVCLGSPEATTSRIVRKHFGAPDLVVREGGKATAEQIDAMADGRDATEH